MASWSLHKKQEKFNDGDDDFQEEDVWSAVKAREVKSKAKSGSSSSSSSSPPSAWQYSSTAPRAIHRGRNDAGDISLAKRSSAPMNIPDWSKIYGKMRKGDDDGSGEGEDCDVNGNGYDDDRDEHRHGDDEDEDEDEDGMVPPHEWLARKLARSQISSFSVCEGIGRTLKGRDLSRVRNAILTKTGFLE